MEWLGIICGGAVIYGVYWYFFKKKDGKAKLDGKVSVKVDRDSDTRGPFKQDND